MNPRILALEKHRFRPPRPPKRKPPNGFLILLLTLMLLAAAALQASEAEAGVFDLPGFLDAGKWSLGVEPDIVISEGAGVGFDFKPRYGVNNNLNWEALIGTGTGSRNFRLGAIADFEWFPDIEGQDEAPATNNGSGKATLGRGGKSGQPGIATPVYAKYMRVDGSGVLEIAVEPMIYKTFAGEGGLHYTPFMAIPIGWDIQSAQARGITQIVFGSMLRVPSAPKFRYSLEAGFNVHQSYSYISGGFTYYF